MFKAFAIAIFVAATSLAGLGLSSTPGSANSIEKGASRIAFEGTPMPILVPGAGRHSPIFAVVRRGGGFAVGRRGGYAYRRGARVGARGGYAYRRGVAVGPRGGTAAYRRGVAVGPRGAVGYRGGVAVGPRGGVAYRGGAVVVRRPVLVGGVYRPYGATWAPGGAIAAGAAIGFVAAATAVAWAGTPPSPNYCWFYTGASRTKGFWDVCPP